MGIFRVALILLLVSGLGFAEDKNEIIRLLIEKKKNTAIEVKTLEQKAKENDKLKTLLSVGNIEKEQACSLNPQSEVDAALKFAQDIAKIDPKRAQYLKFFSTYNKPEAKQEEIYYALAFWIHSLVAPGFNIIAPPMRVPYSPTLYYIFFDDYGWKRESLEFVSKTEPYFRAPWVHFEDLNNLRLITGGNSIFRADWFIYHTSDVTKQVDRNDDNILYYIMIYGKGKEPKTLKEFQDIWGVDLVDARNRGVDAAAILKSYIVARHNRQLLRVRTLTGYYWETFDVRNEDGERDYIENLFPDDNARDASEAIASNNIGLQVYLLVAFEKGKDKRVEFGDPTAVKNIRDIHGDVRVRTARSCVSCHAEGIISFKHELKSLLQKGEFKIEIAARKKEIQLEIQRFYFSPIEEYVEDDKTLYKRAMKLVNGLTPVDNSIGYNNVMLDYDKQLDIEIAAKECGVPVEIFKNRLAIAVSGRLLDMINGKATIPRGVWENQIINAGTFGHAMIFASAIQKKDLQVNYPVQDRIKPSPVYTKPPILNQPIQSITQPVTQQVIQPVIKQVEPAQIVKSFYLKDNTWIWGDNLPEIARTQSWVQASNVSWSNGISRNTFLREIIVDDKYRYEDALGIWRKIKFNVKINGEIIETKWFVLEKDLKEIK